MGIRVIQVPVRGFDKNFSYVLYDEDVKDAAIVDPSGDFEKVIREVERRRLRVVAILLTHSHFDHVEKLRDALDRWYVPIIVHASSAEMFHEDGEVRAVRDGDVFMLGTHPICIMHTPGHTEDAICFFIDANDSADGVPALISGDTVFVEGCGRTNNAGVKQLYESLERIKALPKKTVIYPGHDYGSVPYSTIQHEFAENQYFRAEDFEAFRKLRLG